MAEGNEPRPFVPQVESFTATTTGGGNAYYDFPRNVIVLSAWVSASDTIVTPFPSGNTPAIGGTRWWFQCFKCNASHEVVANTQLTFYVTYI